MKLKLLLILFIAGMATGCSTPPLTINYAPSSTMSVEGAMNVGDFRYIPGERPDIKSNQIRNTAIGNIYFEKNINEYIETALFTEARFVGIDMKPDSTQVTGEIKEFLIDDLGYSVDWTLDIRYQIAGCYDRSQRLHKNTEKFANVFGTLNEVIKLNIEKLFADPEFVSCIQA
ncbi:hypothetical protein [Halopseudomonas oceani]|uniref:hypothetical protein n=1 Tax=Halopseudomonas oceani TaxID=1708783 RepID=UPI002AA7485C|nr:hypothetical protein [Halopseudomonas oceani]